MQTLKLSRPFGKTLLLTSFAFILLFVAVEILLRIEPITSYLPNSNFGGRHEQLETQFARLDRLTAQGDPVNCILLGDSLVWFGIDPERFQIAYKETSGKPLHCFNFGVTAMPAVAAANLADYLVETYNLELLIYGVHARDLAVPVSDEDSQIIINNPGFQYRQGKISPLTWLKAHSLIYRNLEYLPILIHLDMLTARNPLGWRYRQLHGFGSKDFALIDVDNVLPDPEDPGQVEGFAAYWNYQIRDENLMAVKHIADLNSPNRQVIVVVMPVHSNFKYFFQNQDKDYARFTGALKELLDEGETPFWILGDEVNIPASGWFDYSHLNIEGAEILSQWFGVKVGEYMLSNGQVEINLQNVEHTD